MNKVFNKNVIHTLGQVEKSWIHLACGRPTVFNKVFSISFFLTGSLNGEDLVFSCFFKFHVPGPMEDSKSYTDLEEDMLFEVFTSYRVDLQVKKFKKYKS